MKDRLLDLFEILHGFALMSIPMLILASGDCTKVFLLLFPALLIYGTASRKKSLLACLLVSLLSAFLMYWTGDSAMERAALLAGTLVGSVGFLSGRAQGSVGCFGGPAYGYLAVAPVLYLAGWSQKLSYLKERACLFAALYLLLCILVKNRRALLKYCRENRELHRFPEDRVRKNSQKAVLFLCLLAVAAMVAGYLAAPARLSLPKSEKSVETEAEEEALKLPSMDEGQMFFNQEIQEPPLWLKYLGEILYRVGGFVIAVCLVGFVAYEVWDFVKRYREGLNVIQEEEGHSERDFIERIKPERKRFGFTFWGQSPRELIRRHYKKWILRSSTETPKRNWTPREVEEKAGLFDEEVHSLYEKARYSQKSCTKEESSLIRRKTS